jgi:hypothetical protein
MSLCTYVSLILVSRQALDGSMVGDVGFDPLGLSSVADIKFLAEAELKHCRKHISS